MKKILIILCLLLLTGCSTNEKELIYEDVTATNGNYTCYGDVYLLDNDLVEVVCKQKGSATPSKNYVFGKQDLTIIIEKE